MLRLMLFLTIRLLFTFLSVLLQVIGKEGSNIREIEERLGVGIDVQELKPQQLGSALEFHSQITKNAVQLFLDGKFRNVNVDIYVNEDYLLSSKVGKSGLIKINSKNKIGRILLDAINTGENVALRPGD